MIANASHKCRGSRFCHQCGKEIPKQFTQCLCGTVVPDHWKFCEHCGAEVAVSARVVNVPSGGLVSGVPTR